MAGALISSFWEFALPAYLLVLLATACLGLLIYPFKNITKAYEETSTPLLNPLLSDTDSPTKEGPAIHHVVTCSELDQEGYSTANTMVFIPIANEPPPAEEPSGSFCGSPPAASPTSDPATDSNLVAVPALSAALVQQQRQVIVKHSFIIPTSSLCAGRFFC